MRPLLFRTSLCLGALALALGTACAQSSSDGDGMSQLPVGQTFKQFEYPIYQEGKLKATLSAATATGITLNRAETSDLKIDVYDNGAITTTITSPKADLYVSDQKMRTKNTVDIERADMSATSQTCDFNLKTKMYILRNNVKVTLKHFDVSMTPANGSAPALNHAPASAMAAPAPAPSQPARNDSMLDSPGSYADPNAAPTPPATK
jgi:flagellar basal body rod protein FlgB